MLTKKIAHIGIVCFFTAASFCYAGPFYYPGQTIRIMTQLDSVIGKPQWLIIVRDAESERVLPHVFDFEKRDNAWIILTTAAVYHVTVSQLKWGPYAVINNFCGIENTLLTHQSLFIKLQGNLAPDPHSFTCSVEKFNSLP